MEEDKIQYSAENYAPQRDREGISGLVGLVMKMGLAKDEKQANVVMMVILGICIVVGVGVWFFV